MNPKTLNMICAIGIFMCLSGVIYLALMRESYSRKIKVAITLVAVLISGQFAYRYASGQLLCTVAIAQGSSMEPTLPVEPSIHLFKHDKTPERGDIVSLWLEEEDNPYCKRVIGLPGETITIEGDNIYINGEYYNEIGYEHITERDPLMIECTLADDEYFVMGDNRPVSYDSRFFGPVKRSELLYVMVK